MGRGGFEDEFIIAKEGLLDTVDKLAGSTEEPFEVKWGKAMSWWKEQSDTIQMVIRTTATNKLIERGAEEVGSSDVNHAVYGMYQEYIRSSCEDVISFLMDY
jgi:hypothetical protein